ncbi:MAG: M28 family peptidase, partial [Candidatus Aminicenantales bacterium]
AHPVDFTVRFIAFTAEEIGLVGSRVHAAEARAHNENIIGVINLDMIAYPDGLPEDLEIIVNPASEWLAARFLGVCESYGLVDVNRVVDASIIYSDHSPFWDLGYAALLAIEDYPVQNPYYHHTTDTIDTLDFGFFRESARAALALLAELAQPVRAGYPVAPDELRAASYSYSSLFNSFRNIRLSWASRPGAAGYNVYRSCIPHQDYQKLNSSLVASTAYLDRYLRTDNSYFYVVTTVGPDGRESNYSQQAPAWPEISSSVQIQAEGVFDFRGMPR